MTNVTGIVKSIRDIMRKDKGTYGDVQRLEQLGWMFFLKIFDDREQEMEIIRDNYQSPLPEELRWSNWATDEEGITGNELLNFIDNKLLPSLKELPSTGNPIINLVKGAFEDTSNYMKNGTLLRQVINKVNGINFNSSEDRHIFGDIYEKLLSELQAAGDAGEFYTPRAVTQFIVEQVNPKLDEKVMDPACGTGGFLVNVIEHLRKKAKTQADQKLLQQAFSGIEKKHLPYILCMTNLLLHGIDIPSNVKADNTLARPLRDWGPSERVDAIVTNPPFGGVEEDGIEANFPGDLRTKETADLFLVLIMRLLKNGGRAGLVLPDGSLFGEGVKTRIKKSLLEECNLHTIVRLPKSVFAPYAPNVATNLLFLTKGQPTKEVWYYEHQFPKGIKAYNKTNPIKISEFDAIKNWWGNESDVFSSRKESEFAWRVSIEEIEKNNFNLDIKNPNSAPEEFVNTKTALDSFLKLDQEIKNNRDFIKDLLVKAFTGNSQEKENLVKVLIENSTDQKAIKSLTRLIFTLAIQGGLTSQNQEEKIYLEIFNKVKEEKEYLILNRKINKGREIKNKFNFKKFLLPYNWEWSSLNQLGLISPRNKAEDKEEVGFIPMEKISSSFSKSHEFSIRKWGEVKEGFTHFSNGDIVVAKITPCFENGKSTIIQDLPNQIGAGTTELHVFRPLAESVLPEFVLLFLKSSYFIDEGINLMTGTSGQKRIPLPYFAHKPFPLPPREEQKRIVNKASRLLSLINELSENLKKSDSARSILLNSIIKEITN